MDFFKTTADVDDVPTSLKHIYSHVEYISLLDVQQSIPAIVYDTINVDLCFRLFVKQDLRGNEKIQIDVFL